MLLAIDAPVIDSNVNHCRRDQDALQSSVDQQSSASSGEAADATSAFRQNWEDSVTCTAATLEAPLQPGSRSSEGSPSPEDGFATPDAPGRAIELLHDHASSAKDANFSI